MMKTPDKTQNKVKQRFRFIGLRGKLLLVTITLFIFPLAGISYLNELEHFLKNNHEESILILARTIASQFRDNASLTIQNQLLQSPQKAFYSHPLKDTIVIDGYSDDWSLLQNEQQWFQSEKGKENNLSIITANDDHFYYFFVTVIKHADNKQKSLGVVSYAPDNNVDIIFFRYLDYAHQTREFQFKIDSPGWVNGITTPATGMSHSLRGEWQPNRKGYTLEFKVPAQRINRHIAFELKQHSSSGILSTSTLSTKAYIPLHQLNPLLSTDTLSTLQLKQLAPPKTQLWLLNKQQYINARTDKTITANQTSDNRFSLLGWLRRLYLLMMNYSNQGSLYASNASLLNSVAIHTALNGQSSSLWHDKPNNEQLTLSVTTPIFDIDHNVIGVLLLEQDNNTVLALQDKTFERILLITIVLFFGVTLGLLGFSTRLLNRIINLRNDTEKALTNEGEIRNQLYRNDNDEVGDLARSFSGLLSQVEENQQYLKSLSSKLSHELRTPLTIIKSSLENMDSSALSQENQICSSRAREGCIRLNELLNRMSEANRLEQSIATMEKELLDIIDFVRSYIDVISISHPDVRFIYQSKINHYVLEFSPELMAQFLDKLITNAICFHKPGTAIRILLSRREQELNIEINNVGPLIEENKLESIFNSLTSYRQNKNNEVHLGLGLYIARLIVNFHKGRLKVENNTDKQSVSFITSLPISSAK